MKRKLVLLALAALLLGVLATSARADPVVSIPDGSITLTTGDLTPDSAGYWKHVISASLIDAQTGPPVLLEATITGLTAKADFWVEIGLIPKSVYDYWETAYGGNWKYARFNKGVFVCTWYDGGESQYGVSMQDYKNQQDEPYYWPLDAPSAGDPWEFEVLLTPDGDGRGGTANLWVNGQPTNYLNGGGAVSGASLHYGYLERPDEGGTINDEDFSQSYLIVQAWANSLSDPGVEFEQLEAAVTPEPFSMAFMGAAFVGVVAHRVRKRRRQRNS
jgi:hypothetical protein